MIDLDHHPKHSPTLEEIVEIILGELVAEGVLTEAVPVPWDAFLRLSNSVHTYFDVPSTTFTPIMRRLVFALAATARPDRIVGLGTYVGYTFAWLLGDRAEQEAPLDFAEAVGIDRDPVANSLARRNCCCLGHGDRLRFVDGDALTEVAKLEDPIDLLYLDLDHPQCGKADYAPALASAIPRLASGALILAHDPCVARFRGDIETFHRLVERSPALRGPWVLPVDPCGLSVALCHGRPR